MSSTPEVAALRSVTRGSPSCPATTSAARASAAACQASRRGSAAATIGNTSGSRRCCRPIQGAAIRAAIGEHGLAARSLVLLPPRGLPKTTSGKIQRTNAKAQFLDASLPSVARWDSHAHAPHEQDDGSHDGELLVALRAAPARRRADVLVAHMQAQAAELLDLDADDIDEDRPLSELGIDSVTAVELVERVGHALNQEIPGTLLFDYPTLEAIGGFIIDELLGASLDAAPAAKAKGGAGSAADVAAMSEEEAAAALLAELDEL